jgi:hypothetical protein
MDKLTPKGCSNMMVFGYMWHIADILNTFNRRRISATLYTVKKKLKTIHKILGYYRQKANFELQIQPAYSV